MPDVDRGSVVRDWRDRASYADTQRLPSEAWAWEFLRCNPRYCALSRNLENTRRDTESRRWGLVAHCHVGYRGRPLWRPEVSPSVMRFRGSVDAVVARLSLCRITIVRERDGVAHLLAERAGLAIQLVVEPLRHSSARELMLVIPDRPDAARQAAKSMVVFVALAAGRMPMRSGLGPRPNHRLMIVLQALDGALAGATQREIAIAIFGAVRTERAWRDAGGHLRDTVRRAIRRGRFLMNGGYLGLLR